MECLLKDVFVTYILLIAFSLVNSNHESPVYEFNKKCSLYIGCNYTLSVTPSDNCHDDSKSMSRQKRSLDTIKANGGEPQGLVLSRLSKLQHKLTKEMRQLSARVLRGVRRMETDITELTGKNKRGHLSGQGTQCPPGFSSLDNWPHCYLFSTFNTTWYEARDFCSAMESNVVAMGSLREHYVVTFLIKDNPAYRDAEGWWTSGTFVEKTKQWMWSSDLETRPFTFIKWAVNEPNDMGQSNLQCVMLFRGDDHLWHDQLCTKRYNFVCEIPAVKGRH